MAHPGCVALGQGECGDEPKASRYEVVYAPNMWIRKQPSSTADIAGTLNVGARVDGKPSRLDNNRVELTDGTGFAMIEHPKLGALLTRAAPRPAAAAVPPTRVDSPAANAPRANGLEWPPYDRGEPIVPLSKGGEIAMADLPADAEADDELASLLGTAGLTDRIAQLGSLSFEGWCALYAGHGRIKFLAELKRLGVASLSEQQTVASAVEKCVKEASDGALSSSHDFARGRV
mmetsp:Transcript_75545/g.149832  ORF Transcript_75545/g.149832 Transcript_75545/m.149832 type:complete len:232 (-) Transcript_75545:44-739(-)|eukprot:CAMPEP_0174736526 /NCGR_PEP_ID=MMETSP1094-20130205/66815_1 /TAXON_ID=156173 /ORGANISM="Chrysochromulina brevifilum, Strain UTEX LB 985" /LENGTH=231 /DNA_ID=CAMNT_0015939637 /DNA_START=158 /DNA_END=853 /DNA_ORIENTATION=+